MIKKPSNLTDVEINLTDTFDTIYIVDKQYNEILAHIHKDMLPVARHRKDRTTGISQLTLEGFDHEKYGKHLSSRNKAIVPGEDGKWLEFRMQHVEKYRSVDGIKMVDVIGFETYHDLAKMKVIEPFKENNTSEWHVNNAISGTKYKAGTIAYKGSKTIEFEDATDPYKYLLKVAREFDLELDFYVNIDGTKITYYVDLVEQVGKNRGRVVEYGRDLQALHRVEQSKDIVTALVGYGPEREDGTRLRVFVEDRDALARWGENGTEHIVEIYYPQSERMEMTEEELTQYTRTELNKRINALVTYETTVVDLENMPGMENKKLRDGDTIGIVDTDYNPPLYLEARVAISDRDIFNRTTKEIVLGDYIEFTEDEVHDYWKIIRDSINKRMDRMPVVKINSSKGNVFKNDEGETTLYVNTFVDGKERDEDEEFYTYLWKVFDKDGNEQTGILPSSKEIEVSSNQIDEKAVYRIEVRLNNETVGTDEITIYSVSDGKDGKDGTDGTSTYTHIMYSKSDNLVSHNPNDWEQGYIRTDNGQNSSPANPTIRIKDYISIDPEKHYYFKSLGDFGIRYAFYDADKNFIESSQFYVSKSIKSPSNAYYIRFNYRNYLGNETDINPSMIGKELNSILIEQSMTHDGEDATYIGIAITSFPEPPSEFEAYTWSKIRGEDGIPGQPGENGETTYTWVKYADDEEGNGMSDSPVDKSYIGLAFNQTSPTKSNDPGDYTWSKIKGEDAHVTENLISNLPRNWEQGLFSPVNGSPAPNNNAVRTKDLVEIDPTYDYTLSLHHDVGTKTLLVLLYDDDKNLIKDYNGNSITFYADGAKYIRVSVVSQTRLRPEQVGRDVRVLLEVGSAITNWEVPKEDSPYAMEMAKDIILFDDGTGIHIKHDEIVFGDYDGSEIIPIATIRKNVIKSKDELVIDSPKIRFDGGNIIEFADGPSIDTTDGRARLRANNASYAVVEPDGRFSAWGPGALRTFSVNASGTVTTASDNRDYYALHLQPNGNLRIFNSNVNDYVFELDADDGTIISESTRLNESTNVANLRIGNSSGRFFMVTSTKKNKLVAEKISSNPYNILKLDVLDWYDLYNTEKYAELLTRQQNGEDISEELKDIDNLRRIPGVFAEDVERIGLEQFVEYDNDGKIVGVMETRLPLLLIPIVKDLKEENEQLKERLNNLEERLSKLENN